MAGQAQTIRRRKRGLRDQIPEGEFRNVTFRASSTAYNLLIEEANKSQCSISELSEKVIQQAISGIGAKTVKPNPDVWDKLLVSSQRNDRSADEEANHRLNKSYLPIWETACDFDGNNTKASAAIEMLSTVFTNVSFEEIGQNSLARAALMTAFEEILNAVFPPAVGLLADIFDRDDEAVKQVLQSRMKQIAQQIIEVRRHREEKAGRAATGASAPFGSPGGGALLGGGLLAAGATGPTEASLPPFDPRQPAAVPETRSDKLVATPIKKQKRKI